MKRVISLKSVTVLTTCIVLASVGVACQSANAGVVLADWTFETSQPTTVGPFTPETGFYAAGSAATINTPGGSFVGVISSPAGNASAHSFSSNGWNVGEGWTFKTSTLNFHNIQLSWDQTGSATGPRDFKVQYSTDGSSFFDIFTAPTYTVLLNGTPSPAWSTAGPANPNNSYSRDLSAITALNNQPSIYLRLIDTSTTAINGTTVATGGTSRVDNVSISGVPVPPALLIFMGVAGTAGATRRRFRSLLS